MTNQTTPASGLTDAQIIREWMKACAFYCCNDERAVIATVRTLLSAQSLKEQSGNEEDRKDSVKRQVVLTALIDAKNLIEQLKGSFDVSYELRALDRALAAIQEEKK